MHRRIPPTLAAFLLALATAARAADPAAPAPPTAKELLQSMLASDSVMVTRVEITVAGGSDSAKSNLSTKRVAVNQVGGRWIKRFAPNFLAENTALRAELCPPPKAFPGEAKPWMVSVLWINKEGRGQAYVDFANACAFAGLAGKPPVGIDLVHADSLLALFQAGLPKDTVLAVAKLPAASAAAPAAASAAPGGEGLPKYGVYVDMDKAPEAIGQPAPDYPAAARAAGVGGIVLLDALVGPDGTVRDTHLSMGDNRLVPAAVAAVKRMKFKPATFKGKPIAAWTSVPVSFDASGGH